MNYLKTDDQTTSDLALVEEPGRPSVFGLYNRTRTMGGRRRLEDLFNHPLSNAQAINDRADRFRFFSQQSEEFPVESGAVGALAYYVDNDDERTQLRPEDKSLGQKFKDAVASDPNRVFVEDGVEAYCDIIGNLVEFLDRMADKVSGSPYEPDYHQLQNILNDEDFKPVREQAAGKSDPGIQTTAELDQLIRFERRDLTLQLLERIYELDVCIAVGQVARSEGFHFGKALAKEDNRLEFDQLWHPLVEGAIGNNFEMTPARNLTFLTGANMAGKSTLMKAIGVALYLGHIGLPVAAEAMEFSVRDGIFTNINVADKLQFGISHFYAEVLRVKEVAHMLEGGQRLFVIFDELFRGTNVKDAYDGTVEMARGFSRHHESQFIISTHIMEAGQELAEEDLSIQYVYLPTEMEEGRPVYSRILQEGITDDRKGMAIINNENILELLEQGIQNEQKNKSKTASEPCHS